MSETPVDPNVNGTPVFRPVTQYLKDFSFENPGAPASLMPDLPKPNGEVSVDLNAQKIGDDQYEVELAINVTAHRGEDTVYVVETNFAGVFQIQHLDEQQLQLALLVEAPRLLFPFARAIVADAMRDGGLPPLLLEPIDFASMYRMQVQKQQAAGDAAGTA